MKIGKNRDCYCGSGRKYKLCHAAIENEKREIEHRENQTIRLLELADEHFGEISHERKIIDPINVRKFYRKIRDLWPQGTELIQHYPEPSSHLRALYVGDLGPNDIIRNVCRFGLYVDEIYLINPFLHALYGVAEGSDPIEKPEKFIIDTVRNVMVLDRLRGWIRSGNLKFVVDPLLLMTNANRALVKTAIYNRRVFQDYSNEDIEETKGKFLEVHLANTISKNLPSLIENAGESEDRVIEALCNELIKQFPMVNSMETIEAVKSAIKIFKKVPVKLLRDKDGTISEMAIYRNGASLEMTMLLCELIGCFPYTDLKINWKELLSANRLFSEEGQIWSPITHAFQNLKFEFLNWVDPQFVLTIRDDGRMATFRRLLKKIWKDIGGTADPDKIHSSARDFSEQITEEHNKAKAEFEGIRFDLKRWSTGILVGAGGYSIGDAIVGGKLKVALGLAGFAGLTIKEILSARSQQKQKRLQNPMSIFLDLDKPR